MPEPSAAAVRIKRLLIFLPLVILAALIASWFIGGPKQIRSTLPAITLQTLDGHDYSLAPVKGTVRLVELIYTRCPDICPTTTIKMVQLQKRLQDMQLMGKGIEFLTVTIDPANDTPDVLGAYAKQLGIDPEGWTILRGEADRIQELADSLGFVSRKNEDGFYSHTSTTYLVDENNAVVRKFGMGDDFDPDRIYQELVNWKKEGNE